MPVRVTLGWADPCSVAAMRTTLVALLIVAVASCGDDDDDGGETTSTAVGPAPSEEVTAAAYADDWNALSQSLDVVADDNEAPSTESDNWQLRFDPEASDADEGWALMQDFADKFGCDVPERPPRDDVLVVNC
jgi:hypothetical protein